MIRSVAKWWATIAYRWKLESEAGTNEVNAGLAAKNAQAKRQLVDRLNKEADAIEARVKQMVEMLEKGYWECEDGHEHPTASVPYGNTADAQWANCECGKPMKLISRATMSGKEQYESDKEREDVEKIAAERRAQAKEEEHNATQGEAAIKFFKEQAANARATADKVRKL